MKRLNPVVQLSAAVVFAALSSMLLGGMMGHGLPQALGAFFAAFASGAAVATGLATTRPAVRPA